MASARAVLSPSCAPRIAGMQRKRHADRTLVCGTRTAAPRPTCAKDCEGGGGGCWRVVDDSTATLSRGGSENFAFAAIPAIRKRRQASLDSQIIPCVVGRGRSPPCGAPPARRGEWKGVDRGRYGFDSGGGDGAGGRIAGADGRLQGRGVPFADPNRSLETKPVPITPDQV